MTESWEECAKRTRKELGLPEPIPPIKVMTGRMKARAIPIELSRGEKLFNVHKRSLPPGLDKIIVIALSEEEAKQWVEERLKSKCYETSINGLTVHTYYDVVPVDATQKDRSIYFNSGKLTI